MLAVPFVPVAPVTVNASPSASLSLVSTGMDTEMSSGVVAASSTATGGRLVTEVIVGGLKLFVKFGSSAEPPTDAKLVSEEREVAFTVSVRFVVPPAIKLPKLQITWLPFVDAAGVALTKLRPAGRSSVTDKPPEDDGPRFVTEII